MFAQDFKLQWNLSPIQVTQKTSERQQLKRNEPAKSQNGLCIQGKPEEPMCVFICFFFLSHYIVRGKQGEFAQIHNRTPLLLLHSESFLVTSITDTLVEHNKPTSLRSNKDKRRNSSRKKLEQMWIQLCDMNRLSGSQQASQVHP